MDIVLLNVLTLLGIMAGACFLHIVSKKSNIPFSVMLLLGGVLFSVLEATFVPGSLLNIGFNSDILFYIFLPTLIFESAYHLQFRQLKNVFREVFLLSTFGLLISVAVTASAMHFGLGWSWGISVLFAVIIAPTDPAAVLGVLKQIKVPQKLKTIIEGESLVNDGTALILFQGVKALAVGAAFTADSSLFVHQFSTYATAVSGSLLLGGGLGFVFLWAMTKVESRAVQLCISFILAHVTFLLAEGVFHISGVIATMTAGILLGNVGPRKMSETTQLVFREMWDFISFVSTSFVFILLGVKLAQVDLYSFWKEILIASVAVIFIARPLSIGISMFLTNRSRQGISQIDIKQQIVLSWGGLRGALSAAMVLLLPVESPQTSMLVAITGGVILTSFLVNATTLSWVLRFLKMDLFSFAETIQRLEAEILIDEEVRKHLRQLKHRNYISSDTYHTLEGEYRMSEEAAAGELNKLHQNITAGGRREISKLLTYHALMLERKMYEDLFRSHEIDEARYQALSESIYRQIDRLEQDVLPHERTDTVKIAPKIPRDHWLLGWLNTPLVRTWWRGKKQRKIQYRIQHYRARSIAGKAVVREFRHLAKNPFLECEEDLLREIVDRYEHWIQRADRKVLSLEVEHPIAFKTAEMRLARYLCLRKEQEIEQGFYSTGLITDKVAQQYEQKIQAQIRRDCLS